MEINAPNIARLVTGIKLKSEKDIPNRIDISTSKQPEFAATLDSLWTQDGYLTKQEIQQTCDLLKQIISIKEEIPIKDINNNGTTTDIEDIRGTKINVEQNATTGIAASIIGLAFLGYGLITLAGYSSKTPLTRNKGFAALTSTAIGGSTLTGGIIALKDHDSNIRTSICDIIEFGKVNGLIKK